LQPHFIHQVRKMSSNLTNLYFLTNYFSSQFYNYFEKYFARCTNNESVNVSRSLLYF
jgi:hypothetical protein